MTGRVEPICRECCAPFDSDAVYAKFLADYLDRTGWTHTGQRPTWTRHFCSEPCRMTDVHRRAAAANAATTQRRTDRRAATRRDTDR